MLTICHLQRVSTSHSPTSIVAGSTEFFSTQAFVERLEYPTVNRVAKVRDFPDEARQHKATKPASW